MSSVTPLQISFSQGRSRTSVLLWCVQVHARTTQTSTAAWIQWKRCCFQTQRNSWTDSGSLPRSRALAQTEPRKQNHGFSANEPTRFDAALLVLIARDSFRTKCIIHVAVSQQKVEDTVGALEAELASLLEAIEGPKRRPLVTKAGEKTGDVILEEARRLVRSSMEEGLTSAWSVQVCTPSACKINVFIIMFLFCGISQHG